LGNPDTIFYKMYGSSTQYAQVFYDVTYGNNSVATFAAQQAGMNSPRVMGFNAGPGYDEASGIGAPFARALINVVTGL
jgi:hypothetical protein